MSAACKSCARAIWFRPEPEGEYRGFGACNESNMNSYKSFCMMVCVWRFRCARFAVICLLCAAAAAGLAQPAPSDVAFETHVKPLLAKHCLACHSTNLKKGSLDLERFATSADVRKDVKPWQVLIEQVETGEMPPRDKPQLSEADKKQLLAWVRGFLDAEARARSGDPGVVPLRRLSNAEYDATIRDLTGVDLKPAREFPADGAGGEGFTNSAEALSDISPALAARYLQAAKEIADHAVLLPDSYRFSPSKTRRDWTDEGTARLRKFYADLFPPDGKLNVQPYLLATIRQRDDLRAGRWQEAAAKEKVNSKYLRILWEALNETAPSQPLDSIRGQWKTATEQDVPALVAEIAAWQAALWKTVKVGNYISANWHAAPDSAYLESLSRHAPVDPPAKTALALRVPVKLAPGQSEVRLYLAAREASPSARRKDGLAPSEWRLVWQRPRFEGAGKPTLLLRDYASFGPAFEIDYRSAFARTAAYLGAVAEAVHDSGATLDNLAKRHGLDTTLLKNWSKLLALSPRREVKGTTRPAAPLELLDDKVDPTPHRPALSGWKKKGIDLPTVVANASDQTLQIPGRVSARTVAAHPTPQEFVGIAWKSPIDGAVQLTAHVAHAHPACGNGVAWWLEQRRGEQATLLGDGLIDLGKEARHTASIQITKGDLLVLAIDPRDANHICDMTEVWLTITETDKPGRVWDLAKDVSNNLLAGNPHADSHGRAGTWSFVRGPAAKKSGPSAGPIPVASVLGKWRLAAADPARRSESETLAREAESLLTGPRPANEKADNRAVYDRLSAPDGPLFTGVDVTKMAKRHPGEGGFGLSKERFVPPEHDGITAISGQDIEIRLPAALFVDREFVVDVQLDETAADGLVRVRAATTPTDTRGDGPVLGDAKGAAYKRLVAGHAEFRKLFPLFVCFPQVVPTDEVVTLKMFHREDEPLTRLFLSEEQTRRLDRMWDEQRFISRQPKAEYDYLPQFMGFTTQDTPKAFQQFFIDRKPLFKKHADEFVKAEDDAVPRQLDALLDFAGRAYRRPLLEKEKAELRGLYETIRKKGPDHGEAFRGVLARILVAPAFLFRIEVPFPGKEPVAVNDWELATRLSYFLWSSMPDAELRRWAADGKLREPAVLEQQVRRMLKDERTRMLAIEFGTQWIHVRGIDDLKEKNEKLFPTFDAGLRQALYEEAILFFQELFKGDRPVTDVLEADYMFVNELLAKHYGIPGVVGAQWRRIDGVRKFGRGGILAMGSVHAKQSGASRTSPVLRGNWVVETLLGEKLPRPPANVPILPDQEGTDRLTTRQMVEQHVLNPSCAACHARIDPFGFAFENFDAIGRFRIKESSGLPVDARARLREGTEFEGIDGLRHYLVTKKKDVITRLICQKLLGYALGRAKTLSDTTLIDTMVAELNKNDGRMSAAVFAILRSPQFRMIRGKEYIP